MSRQMPTIKAFRMSLKSVSFFVMQLQNFMHYPNLACRVAMMHKYQWRDSELTRMEASLWQRLRFLFGAGNLIYQNFGLLIYLWLPDHQTEELSTYVAQLSETGSVLGLTLVGASNMWILLRHRKQIESMLAELQQLYPLPRQRGYRVVHYYQESQRLMKYTTVFFVFAYAFYNSLPLVELVYELSSELRYVKYKFQSNTWYPWRIKESVVGFTLAYLSQALSSLVGAGFITASQFLLCFFTTQMQLHFDALANKLRLLDASKPTAENQIKLLIAYHNRLLRLENNVNSVFNFIFFINFTTSTIAICLMAFAMVMINLASALKYSVGLMAFLVFTLSICYTGTQFTTASDKLLPAAFYNNWYEGNLAYRKMLLFFMMSACKSRVLRAYKFTPVSLATYMAILKFSYQMFTFLRTMT